MSKRGFRSTPSPEAPGYPTLDRGRRDFLTRLGGALLGAGALGVGLSACGDRSPVTMQPDIEPIGADGGVAPLPDAGGDGVVRLADSGGVAPNPDAVIDPPDGEAPLPDAGIDMQPWGGVAPPPDASIDEQDLGGPAGVPRLPDASCDDDGGSCPVP